MNPSYETETRTQQRHHIRGILKKPTVVTVSIESLDPTQQQQQQLGHRVETTPTSVIRPVSNEIITCVSTYRRNDNLHYPNDHRRRWGVSTESPRKPIHVTNRDKTPVGRVTRPGGRGVSHS